MNLNCKTQDCIHSILAYSLNIFWSFLKHSEQRSSLSSGTKLSFCWTVLLIVHTNELKKGHSSAFSCLRRHKKRIHQENEWHDKDAWLHQIMHNILSICPSQKNSLSLLWIAIHLMIQISIQHQERDKKRFKWIQFTTHCLMSKKHKTTWEWLNVNVGHSEPDLGEKIFSLSLSFNIFEWHVTNHSPFENYDWFYLLTFM